MREEAKANLKAAFTEFPFCIATYLALGGFIGLIVCNWPY
jgi:hypothetical protein